MSYNAALRAVHAGYKNVLWYRGGIEAWNFAGLPTHQQQQGQQAQPAPAQQPGQPSQPRNEPMAKFEPVMPLARGNTVAASAARPSGELRIGQGRHFSFALPPGWGVGENGQYALTLVGPDNHAMTLMVGNSGFPLNYPTARFAYEKLSSSRPQNLQLSPPREAGPVAGFRQAVELPMTRKYYWTNNQGSFVGTDDPSANPNVGSTGEWRKMERVVK